MTPLEALAVLLAGIAAGALNTIVGSGSLLTFPTLLAVGLPPITANVSNTIGLVPGGISGTLGYRRELAGQRDRLVRLAIPALLGGTLGAALLLVLPAAAFEVIVPFLLLFAAVLLALQGRLRKLLARDTGHRSIAFAIVPVALAAIYGAYFGAGLGILLLAILAVTLEDSVVRANALKQLLTLAINTCAALFFLAYGKVDWSVAGVVAGGSLVGGVVGGKLASRIPEAVLRWFAIFVAVGVAVRELISA